MDGLNYYKFKNMESKYRFKTKEEFIRDGLWDDEYNVPNGWDIGGNMNELLGQDISVDNNDLCNDNKVIYEHGRWFSHCDYVLKEEGEKWSEWFPTKETNANGFEYFGDTLMEVSDTGIRWFPRVVFGKKGDVYLAWTDTETLEDAKNEYNSSWWNYARPIKTKLTLKQVAEKFGLEEDEIEIIES